MANTFPNMQVNELEEMSFIGGSYREFTFYTNDSSGSPIDMTYMNGLWTLSPLGFTDYISASKVGISAPGYFMIKLMKADTENLAGKFIQRAFVTGVPGYEYRLAQGVINIIPGIGMDNYG